MVPESPHLRMKTPRLHDRCRAAFRARVSLAVAAALVLFACLASCEVNSFLDPSVVGRWERTPVVLPILDHLDVIDEPPAKTAGLTPVAPQDLVPDVSEYVMGPGDLVTVTIFELLVPNVESVQTRRADELGAIRLPVVGAVKIAGLTPTQLEKQLGKTLQQQGVIRDATVSVIVQEARQRTYSVIGEPSVSGTGIGTYTIPRSDFRVLEAMAMARGVPGRVKKLYIIRAAQLLSNDSGAAATRHSSEASAASADEAARKDLLRRAEFGIDAKSPPAIAAPVATGGEAIATPSVPELALDASQQPATKSWVYRNGRWLQIDAAPKTAVSTARASAAPPAEVPRVTQRIVEVPYDKLLDGEMRYNIVIRPGDVIRVPAPVIGNVYIGGAIARPGTYSLPGERDVTLKQLVFAAGNLAPLAIPERVDLIRRIGDDQEATLRLNLREIFNGTQPDVFLKPNDTINIGTNFVAMPLAVVRNGFRANYGFGFLFDRNFATDVFGPERITVE